MTLVPRRAELEAEEEGEAKASATAAPPRPVPAIAQVLGLQKSVGNAAVSRLLSRKEGDGEQVSDAGAPGGAPGGADAALTTAIAERDVAAVTGATMAQMSALTKGQKVDAIFVLLQDSEGKAEHLDALSSYWISFGEQLPDMMYLYYGTWKQCNEKGAKLPRWTLWDMFDLWKHIGPEVITSHQAGRVMPAVLALSEDDYMLWRKRIYFALSGIQRAYINKALAAGRSMADIETFAEAIQMKSDDWLKTNLNVVEESDTGGTGISQQWQMSCGPTTVQVLHAQTDPIYALSLTQSGNLNVTGAGDVSTVGGSQTAKTEQGAILQGQGSTPTEIGTAGTGAWVESDMEKLKASTGLKYTYKSVTATLPTNAADSDVDKAFTAIANFLDQGMYVPIVIGGTPGQTAHYNMVLRHDTTKGLLIHDPGKGASGWCTRQMFLDNNLKPPLAWRLLAGYDVPSKA